MSDDIERPSLGNLLIWAAGVSAPIIVALMGFKVIPREDIWIWLVCVVGMAMTGFLVRLLGWKTAMRRRAYPQMRNEIVDRAVHHKWNKSHGTLCSTMLVNGTDFREFCLMDFSEAWLVNAPSPFAITDELRRQIVTLSRNLEQGDQNGHQKVIIVVLAWKPLKIAKKRSMTLSLDALKESSSLSPKISFEVWDKEDLKV